MKRKPTSTHGKPALDGRAFQHLLAAVYILQEHHDRLLNKQPKGDCAALSDWAEDIRPIQQVAPLTPERLTVPVLPLESVIPVAQAEVEPLSPQYDSVIPPGTAYQLSVLASQLEALIQQQIRTNSEWTTRPPSRWHGGYRRKSSNLLPTARKVVEKRISNSRRLSTDTTSSPYLGHVSQRD